MAEAPEQECICGPDVAAIGWIPYFKNISKVPPNSFTKHKFSYPAFSVLFDSGNEPPPPASFTGSDDFISFLNSDNFRGALGLWNVKVCCSRKTGRPASVSFTHLEEVGYTPINVEFNWPIMGDPKATVYHSKGVGGGGIYANFSENCATLTQWVRFKIGGIGNLGSWIMTGQWAPSAWLRIDYTICCDGSVQVEYSGSYIPSQYYYMDWSRVGLYDMLDDDTTQIDGFLNAGDCKDAPGALHYLRRAKGHICEYVYEDGSHVRQG